jgi:hypothetical protein
MWLPLVTPRLISPQDLLQWQPVAAIASEAARPGEWSRTLNKCSYGLCVLPLHTGGNAIRLPGELHLKVPAALHLPAEPSGEAALP